MPAYAHRRPALALIIAAVLLTALFAFLPAGPASAHDDLVSSDPAAGSTVETLPDEMTLTFSAALIVSDGGTAVVVTDADGTDLADGAPVIDGAVVIQKLKADAATAGEYTVLWQVVSSDGHPTDGEFSFTVNTAAESSASPTTGPTPEESAVAQTPTATPEDTAAPDQDQSDSAPASPWIWVLAIVGILIVVGIVIWLIMRSRRRAPDADSDAPAER